jgi:predicted aspartyl protease
MARLTFTGRTSLGLGMSVLVACTWTLRAQRPEPAALLHTGDMLMNDLHYRQALDAYREARETADAGIRVHAGAGVVRSLLRLGRFADARREGAAVAAADPTVATALAVNGDALWASGLFLEAEDQYAAALAIDPHEPSALHGRGRSRAAQHELHAALDDLNAAIAADPHEALYQFTLASIYEQLRDFDQSAAALRTYLTLLQHADETDTGAWAKAQIAFLESFRGRQPVAFQGHQAVYTIPFTMQGDRMVVKGRINGGTDVDFAVDTGAEYALISATTARRAAITPVTELRTAGVGELDAGFRHFQAARLDEIQIGDLDVKNVPCLVKGPAPSGIPTPEGDGFSPLALGLSMNIDYARHVIVLADRLPGAADGTAVPMRMQRVATVRGLVNGSSAASFVLDTGGEATSLSRSTASRLTLDPAVRRVPVKVYGLAGWDRSANLLPFVNIDFGPSVQLTNTTVVVLNLDAPSDLLGFDIGGIIGQEFLRHYKAAVDLQRSELRLQSAQ